MPSATLQEFCKCYKTDVTINYCFSFETHSLSSYFKTIADVDIVISLLRIVS